MMLGASQKKKIAGEVLSQIFTMCRKKQKFGLKTKFGMNFYPFTISPFLFFVYTLYLCITF